jgi:CheY-like chemotaxis protein
MSTKKETVKENIQKLNNELKKYLWGANQNKEKIIRLVESNINNFSKAVKIKEKERELRTALKKTGKKNTLAPDRTARELSYLEQELKKLASMQEDLTSPERHWPQPRQTEGLTPAREKAGKKVGRDEEQAYKILIIEDEPIIIKSISYFLLQENFSVLFSLNAEDGLAKTLNEKPDLIVLDIMMPGMNGYQFLSHLKKTKEISHIPVIILSSLSRESDVLQGLERGAADYLTKPFSPKVLLSKIHKILPE